MNETTTELAEAFARRLGTTTKGKSAKVIANYAQLEHLSRLKDSGKLRWLEPPPPAPANVTQTIETGFGQIQITRDDCGRAYIKNPKPVKYLKHALVLGKHQQSNPAVPQHWRDVSHIAFRNASDALAALRNARAVNNIALYRALHAQTAAAFLAGCHYGRLSLSGHEKSAEVGGKIYRAAKGPRKPSLASVPGAIQQIKGWQKVSVNKVSRQLQAQFPKMTLENIKRQIRKARARAKKPDSKA